MADQNFTPINGNDPLQGTQPSSETRNNAITDSDQSEKQHIAELEQKYAKELEEYEHRAHLSEQPEAFGSGRETVLESQNYNDYNAEGTDTDYAGMYDTALQDQNEKEPEETILSLTASWLKAEWQNNRKKLLRKALIGAAVTTAGIGLLALTQRKKEQTLSEKLLSKI